MTEGVDYYLHYWQFPNMASECFVVPNDDGTSDIHMNTRYPMEILKKRLMHELEHIRLNHIQDCRHVSELEAEADGREYVRPGNEPKGRTIPLFESPEALGRWVLSFG